MEKVQSRWDHARKTTKHIYEHNLRQLMSSLSEKGVKESLKMNEEKLTLRFNTCLILMKDINMLWRMLITHGKKFIFFTSSLFMLVTRMKRMMMNMKNMKKLKNLHLMMRKRNRNRKLPRKSYLKFKTLRRLTQRRLL